jgi:Zn-dependent alcohol dehydrogenase
MCQKKNSLFNDDLQVLVEMTNGGVDSAVECTGNINAMISAFECVHDV